MENSKTFLNCGTYFAPEIKEVRVADKRPVCVLSNQAMSTQEVGTLGEDVEWEF